MTNPKESGPAKYPVWENWAEVRQELFDAKSAEWKAEPQPRGMVLDQEDEKRTSEICRIIAQKPNSPAPVFGPVAQAILTRIMMARWKCLKMFEEGHPAPEITTDNLSRMLVDVWELFLRDKWKATAGELGPMN